MKLVIDKHRKPFFLCLLKCSFIIEQWFRLGTSSVLLAKLQLQWCVEILFSFLFSYSTKFLRNVRNTVISVKRLIGRKYSDPLVQQEIPKLPFTVKQLDDDGVGIEVMYAGQSATFVPEQIAAMLLSKIKQNAEQSMGTKAPIQLHRTFLTTVGTRRSYLRSWVLDRPPTPCHACFC